MTARTSFPVVPITQVPTDDVPGSATRHLPVVLIVDDERVVADTLAIILGLNGYATMTAYDGHAAFEIAQLVPPELLITDVAMPRMNGIELAIKVRHAAPDCEVILFSGHDVTLPVLESTGRGGHAFEILKKPLPPATMLAHVAECLRRRETALGEAAQASTEHCRVFRPVRHPRAEARSAISLRLSE